MIGNPAVNVVAPLAFKNVGYDPQTDFVPVAQVSRYEFGGGGTRRTSARGQLSAGLAASKTPSRPTLVCRRPVACRIISL